MSVAVLDGGSDGALVYDTATELPIAHLSKFESAADAAAFLRWWEENAWPDIRAAQWRQVARRRWIWDDLSSKGLGRPVGVDF